MDQHDDWNLLALGALNAAHLSWWLSLLNGEAWLRRLFWMDAGYIVLDAAWLVFSPSCVAPRVWQTLCFHHLSVLACVPVAIGRPLLMSHFLRTWIVELSSWTHIAARRLKGTRVAALLERLNKPIYVGLRMIGFPLTYVVYARERAASPALLLQSPTHLHVPLSAMHFVLYGLMLKWGWGMLRPARAPATPPKSE